MTIDLTGGLGHEREFVWARQPRTPKPGIGKRVDLG